ncbi:hypothetical protein DFP73DRAFT_541452 [Morchella snyderi]|nr:hypothetical protein DFP73DRAFT_541452 [Morchella snyderi]
MFCIRSLTLGSVLCCVYLGITFQHWVHIRNKQCMYVCTCTILQVPDIAIAVGLITPNNSREYR